MATQNYVILSQEEITSKITGKPCVKITLVGATDRKEYITYIDSGNYNEVNWQHITRNPTHGFVLRNLKIKTHKGKEMINADSKPMILAEDDNSDRILTTLKDVWQEQDHKEKNNFRGLFE